MWILQTTCTCLTEFKVWPSILAPLSTVSDEIYFFFSSSTPFPLNLFIYFADFLFKFLVIGSAGTGKSCILHQFIEGKCELPITKLLSKFSYDIDALRFIFLHTILSCLLLSFTSVCFISWQLNKIPATLSVSNLALK